MRRILLMFLPLLDIAIVAHAQTSVNLANQVKGTIPSLNVAGTASATALSVSGTSTLAAMSAAGVATFNGSTIFNQAQENTFTSAYVCGVCFNSSGAPSVYSSGFGVVSGGGTDLRAYVGGTQVMAFNASGLILDPGYGLYFDNSSASPDIGLRHDPSIAVLDVGLNGTNANGSLQFTGYLTPITVTCGSGLSACATTDTSLVPGGATISAGMYAVDIAVECTTAVSTATATASVTYTDGSGTPHTITPASAAACTTLGAGSIASVSHQVFRAQASSPITYAATLANSPDYHISIAVYRETAQ